MRTAIGAAIINDSGQLLIVKKKESWILPGGKPSQGESDASCLEREVREELSGTRIAVGRHYGDFEGITPNTGDTLRAVVYTCALIGELGNPSAEIKEKAWLNYSSRGDYKLSDITSKIVEDLYKNSRSTGFR